MNKSVISVLVPVIAVAAFVLVGSKVAGEYSIYFGLVLAAGAGAIAVATGYRPASIFKTQRSATVFGLAMFGVAIMLIFAQPHISMFDKLPHMFFFVGVAVMASAWGSSARKL